MQRLDLIQVGVVQRVFCTWAVDRQLHVGGAHVLGGARDGVRDLR